MAVYFVLGGSGRGKSYFVNHTVVERAQAEKDKTFLMIVPEQATMCPVKYDWCIFKRKI